jgi:HK97 family phage portal protein
MTIAGALSRSIESPNQPLTSTSLAAWLAGGKTKAGTLASEQRVLGLPAYYRAMAIRSGVEAALPLKVYKRGTRQRVLQRTVLDRPNPAQTAFAFRQTMRMASIGWGNAYARKVRNGADVVVELWPMHTSRVRVEAVDITAANPQGKLFLVRDRHGVEHRWTSWEVFHLPFMSPDGITGVSALQAFRESLGTAIAAEDAAGSFFANGSRLAGVLQSKKQLNETSATRLKQRWRDLTSGADRAGDVAVLDNETEFKPIAIPPQDAQLLSSRQWAVTEIARMVGVMPHMIGDTERSTSWGTGIEAQFIGWVQTMVYPELRGEELLITDEILPGGVNGSWFAEFDLNGLLRGDSQARSAFYHQMRMDGVFSQNDILALENREPVDGGDDYLLPAGVMPSSLAELKTKVEAVGALVRAGFEPAAACAALGLDPISHTGLVPITVTTADSLAPAPTTGGN